MPDSRTQSARWAEVLTALECDLENSGSTDGTAWTAPVGLGPLPPELTERAARLVEGQHASIESLRYAQQDVRRHLTALRSVPSTQREDQAVYLDVAG